MAEIGTSRGTKKRAGDETRTRDIFLGKEVLYQLSYTRSEATAGRWLRTAPFPEGMR
jgi:hypothetical protein